MHKISEYLVHSPKIGQKSYFFCYLNIVFSFALYESEVRAQSACAKHPLLLQSYTNYSSFCTCCIDPQTNLRFYPNCGGVENIKEYETKHAVSVQSKDLSLFEILDAYGEQKQHRKHWTGMDSNICLFCCGLCGAHPYTPAGVLHSDSSLTDTFSPKISELSHFVIMWRGIFNKNFSGSDKWRS